MIEFKLTALSSEQSLIFGEPTKYYLVFNNGDLRIEVSEAIAEEVIKKVYSDVSDRTEDREDNTSNGSMASYTEDPDRDEDGIDQV